MGVFNKKETFTIGDKSRIYNNQTIMDFIYDFGKQFNLEILNIEASSLERKFNIHYLYYKESIQKDTIIEISDYDATLKYMLETKGIDELSFRNNYKNQTEFIQKYL